MDEILHTEHAIWKIIEMLPRLAGQGKAGTRLLGIYMRIHLRMVAHVQIMHVWLIYFFVCLYKLISVLVNFLLLGLGQVSHLWFGFGKFPPKNPKLFLFFSLRIKKYLRDRSKNTRVKDWSTSHLLRIKSILSSWLGPSLVELESRLNPSYLLCYHTITLILNRNYHNCRKYILQKENLHLMQFLYFRQLGSVEGLFYCLKYSFLSPFSKICF